MQNYSVETEVVRELAVEAVAIACDWAAATGQTEVAEAHFLVDYDLLFYRRFGRNFEFSFFQQILDEINSCRDELVAAFSD